MLTSKILRNKRTLIKEMGETITDFIYSTFRFPTAARSNGFIRVNQYENMRPDLVAERIYGDQSKWDALLKFNGISNPFSIGEGDLLYGAAFADLQTSYVNPRIIEEREQKQELNISGISTGDVTDRDANRVNNLQAKNGGTSPNVNRPGDKNVKIKDGRVVFGEDVTTINKDNCPTPISRSRLQRALLKDKLFL